MDLPTALLRDLLNLSVSVDGNGDGDLGSRLTALISALGAAVPSYRGLYLTVYDNEQPVSLTSFLPTVDGEIKTSLRLPFTALSPQLDSRSQVIFYATTRGAFLDLAADLGHALHAPTRQAEHSLDIIKGAEDDGQQNDGRPRDDRLDGDWSGDGRHGHGHVDDGEADGMIILDADLPPHTLVSQLAGLHEASMINRAIGMLIDQGHHPDDPHATLLRHAIAAGIDTHIYATRLLRR